MVPEASVDRLQQIAASQPLVHFERLWRLSTTATMQCPSCTARTGRSESMVPAKRTLRCRPGVAVLGLNWAGRAGTDLTSEELTETWELLWPRAVFQCVSLPSLHAVTL